MFKAARKSGSDSELAIVESLQKKLLASQVEQGKGKTIARRMEMGLALEEWY